MEQPNGPSPGMRMRLLFTPTTVYVRTIWQKDRADWESNMGYWIPNPNLQILQFSNEEPHNRNRMTLYSIIMLIRFQKVSDEHSMPTSERGDSGDKWWKYNYCSYYLLGLRQDSSNCPHSKFPYRTLNTAREDTMTASDIWWLWRFEDPTASISTHHRRVHWFANN